MAKKDITSMEPEEILENVRDKFEENKNTIYIVLTILILVPLGYIGYKKYIKEPAEIEAVEEVNNPDLFSYFEKDSTNVAIYGKINSNPPINGYANIAEEYSGTDAGNIARYQLGVSYLNDGKFAEAAQTLEGVSFEDDMLGSIAKGALGDAYLELGQADDALNNYQEAVDHSNNQFTVPIYLKKMALVYTNKGEKEKAIECYEKIKNEYPASNEAFGVEKYIANLK